MDFTLEFAKIATLDGDTVEVFDSVSAAEFELTFYSDEHWVVAISADEYHEFLAENGFC